MISRTQIEVRGIVQGVGFRPYIYNLAKKHSLNGHVLNDTRGVSIEIEGEEAAIKNFLSILQDHPPPLSRIDSLGVQEFLAPAGYKDFAIQESSDSQQKLVLISPDVATCFECLAELMDPANRRYRYPFINCTNCGPRFTIIQDIPYDRSKTTMQPFAMCAHCEEEYNNPSDRRFHAQPNACPDCGPQISLNEVARTSRPQSPAVSGDAALRHVVRELRDGKIVALKGIGGFHLACDALNESTVSTLRNRKYREDKPFALMARSVDEIREYCALNAAEEKLMTSHQRPIVLLRKKPDCEIPEAVAPKLKHLGFMLPYSPLHHLILQGCPGPLVMTSGNISDEPIQYEDQKAFDQLSPIADCFLTHDREIHIRCDDSVTRVVDGNPSIIRRSRGYAPDPIPFEHNFSGSILACGAELKSTFCLTTRNYAFVSHHIGDLENLETLQSFQEGIEHYKKLFYIEPEVIAYDLHPEYLSTKYAKDQDHIPKKIGVQHHHAHIASCMADNGLTGDVIGVAMDGLGYGLDGKLWGCEFLIANMEEFSRVAHLAYVPMRGGSKAVREPWRMAATYLHHAYGTDFLNLPLDFNERLDRQAWRVLEKLSGPMTSSMGRCFDAVSSLLGIRDRIQYEGEAAIELEAIAAEDCDESYEFEQSNEGSTIEASPVLTGIVEDLMANVSLSLISAKFHNAVANLIVSLAMQIRKDTALNRVTLSGGVFQNRILLERTTRKLEQQAFQVYVHHRIPANDGGISLGQAVIADARIKAGKV